MGNMEVEVEQSTLRELEWEGIPKGYADEGAVAAMEKVLLVTEIFKIHMIIDSRSWSY